MTENYLKLLTKRFSEKEITDTGSKLSDIDERVFKLLVNFRELINTEVFLLKNGMTTGNHKSPGHKLGRAYDITVPKSNFYEVFKCAIDSGFNKIGVYWNGNQYSYHLEKSEKAAFWMGSKSTPGKGSWDFGKLIKDPSEFN